MIHTKIKPSFTDDRGEILNVLQAEIKHVALIHSHKGAVRGNHLHHVDEHYSYMLFGMATYIERVDDHAEVQLLEPGSLVFTPKERAHVFIFHEPSAMMTFSKAGLRTGDEYQKDTVPTELFNGNTNDYGEEGSVLAHIYEQARINGTVG